MYICMGNIFIHGLYPVFFFFFGLVLVPDNDDVDNTQKSTTTTPVTTEHTIMRFLKLFMRSKYDANGRTQDLYTIFF